MAWTMYEINALDTLFFRDGRPFVAGEGTDVAGRFPPTPFTLQGLIRSKLLSLPSGCTQGWARYKQGCDSSTSPCPEHNHCVAKQVVGSVTARGQHSGSLRLRGPWILVNGCPVLPIPMDLIGSAESLKQVAAGRKGTVQTALLSPQEGGGNRSSSLPGALQPLAPPLSWIEQKIKFEGVPGFMVWDKFKEYLCGKAPELTLNQDWWRPSDLWQEEWRPGLEIEDERSRAKEGMLYFVRHTRPKEHVALAVEVAGLESLASAMDVKWMSPFGGERRPIRVARIEPSRNPWSTMPNEIGNSISKDGHVKLVFTQIAWFPSGWIPSGWDEQAPAARWNSATATWLAARMERPEVIGGWDLAKGDQKPVRRFVPPGAVYYLKADPNGARAWLRLWNASLSETPPGEPFEYEHMGLGHVFVGTWCRR